MRRDEHDIIDHRPGRYYVSARRDDGAAVLLLGPFPTHQEAIEHVDDGRQRAHDYGDPRAPWYRYGTCRLQDDAPTARAIFGGAA